MKFNPFNLFGETKETIDAPVTYSRLFEQTTAAWTSRNYNGFAVEGYKKNVIAHRCIREIADNLSSITWVVTDKKGEAYTEHPLLTLLNRPNPMQGKASFFRSLHTYKQLAGNSFIYGVGNSSGIPGELYVLPPQTMTIKPGNRMLLPSSYEYNPGSTVKVFDVDQTTGMSEILHIKTVNPLDQYYGMSPLEAAAYSIDTHNESSAWNMKLLQNGGRPSGLLKFKDGLTPEQKTLAQSTLKEHYSGSNNAGNALVLGGDVDFTEMQLSPKDMDYLNARNTSARDIAMAFRIPPVLLNIGSDTTYANMQEARLALWEENLVPEIEYLIDELNNWLVPKFGDDIILTYDKDAIQALAYRRKITHETVQNADFLTINEKRAVCGYSEVIGGDEVLVPLNLVPLGQDIDDAEDELVQEPIDEPTDEGEDEPTDEDKGLITTYSVGPTKVDDTSHSHKFDGDYKSGSTQDDSGHSHTYVIGANKTGITNGHSHPMPAIDWL